MLKHTHTQAHIIVLVSWQRGRKSFLLSAIWWSLYQKKKFNYIKFYYKDYFGTEIAFEIIQFRIKTGRLQVNI